MNIQSDISCKRKAILNSAMDTIRMHGFHGSPMSLIAKNAGVACGTIYHYFTSKEAIIKEIFREVHDEIGSAVFVARDTTISFEQQFFKEVRKLYTYYLEHPSVLHFIDLYKNSPYFSQTINEKNLFVSNFLAFCNTGVQEAAIQNIKCELFIPIVFGTVSSMAKVHIAGLFCYTEESVNSIINIIWQGMKMPADRS